MHIIVLAPNEAAAQSWQYRLEDQSAALRCTPCTAVGPLLPLPADAAALLLLPGGESAALLRALRTAPPLAPPYIFGENAPDGPLPAPEALPALLQALRGEPRLPALAQTHLAAAADLASALLRMLEVPRRLRAWAFLPDMIALTVVHPPLLTDLQHRLYPLTARRHGMTPAAVERSLRLCVESTWTHGSLAALERFFGASVDPERGKPTNREFLCRMQERLTLAMGRLI